LTNAMSMLTIITTTTTSATKQKLNSLSITSLRVK
jgi:hypothetical protein